MDPKQLALRPEARSVFDGHRAEYLAQLVAPMDDMWASFADAAAPHALLVEGALAGSCCVDDDGQLLRFYVLPRFQQHSQPLLRLVLRELKVAHMIVCTLDPNYLASALDLSSSVECHSLLFASLAAPKGADLEPLRTATLNDHASIVDFQVEAVGMPRAFLEGYVRERLERQEMLLFEQGAQLRCVGELRRDKQQVGIAHVGLIVHQDGRGKGVGSRMLTSLVQRARAQGLRPHCSSEVDNVGARHAIERAGFRAEHRVLRVAVAP